MKKQFLLLAVLFNTLIHSQDLQNSNWVFGENTGLNFANTTATPSAIINTALDSNEANASVSDCQGDLLFYSDGESVYTKNHTLMPNGSNLYGNQSMSQGALIVAQPRSGTIYYLFHNLINSGYYYSIIDMSLNGGLGDVVSGQKNIHLLDDLGNNFSIEKSSEKMTSISLDNNEIWVVLQHRNKIHAYKINNTGLISNSPLATSLASTNISSTTNVASGIGNMKISPDGQKLAVAYKGGGFLAISKVSLFDFNITTGLVSNENIIISGYDNEKPYGVEFSADSKLLYFTTIANGLFQTPLTKQSNNNKQIPTNDKLYQYRIASTNIKSSFSFLPNPLLIASSSEIRGLQRGIDDKIYVCQNSSYMGVINTPNNTGSGASGCNYVNNQISLYGKNSNLNLPQWVYGTSGSSSWALDFGATYQDLATNPFTTIPNKGLRTIRGIETDLDGNIYVMGTYLSQQSTQLTNIANGNDFTNNEFFIAKFSPCKELITFNSYDNGSQAHYATLHYNNTNNSLYVSKKNGFTNGQDSLYKINKDNLSIDWEKGYTSFSFIGNDTTIDKITGNIYIKGTHQSKLDGTLIAPNTTPDLLITKINSTTGSLDTFYKFNLSSGAFHDRIEDIVVHNNDIFVTGYIENTNTFNFGNTANFISTGNFLAKLKLINGVITPISIINLNSTLSSELYIELTFNGTDNLLYISGIQRDKSNTPFPLISTTIAFTGDLLSTNFTINHASTISDVRYNPQNNQLYFAKHTNTSNPVYLEKYNATTGGLVWQASETFAADEFMINSSISFDNNNIYMTGLYEANATLPQTNLPASVGSVDLFGLRVQDLGTTYGYKVATNFETVASNTNLEIPPTEENNFIVYPNPFTDNILLKSKRKLDEIYTVQVTDMFGVVKLQQNINFNNKVILQTKHLNTGIYTLTITSNNRTIHTHKLIK